MTLSKLLRGFALSILLAVFSFSAVKLITSTLSSYQEQHAFEELSAYVNTALEPSRSITPFSASGQSDVQPSTNPTDSTLHADCITPGPTFRESVAESDFAIQAAYVSPYLPLKEQNSDFYGWLSISGTIVDYPVMYTPNDPQYYLYRAFDKSSSQSGVPFMDAACFDGCGNYLIHGHNMKNGAMFAMLLSYAQSDFWQLHPSIQFDTIESPGNYEIIAAFYSKVYAPDEEGFMYYQYTDLTDSKDFDTYIEQVQQASLYETGITAQYGDQLLTLSTCSYHVSDGRFVVVAKRVT